MRPIDADALVGNIGRVLSGTEDLEVIVGAAVFITSSELAPTLALDDLRPKGRWIDKGVRDWHCSECDEKLRGNGWDGYVYKDLPKFCPDCGADMRGGGEDA